MKKFIRENIDHQPIVDNVFKIVNLANDAIAKKGKENIVNATIGSLYDEDGNSVESAPHPQQKLAVDLGTEIEKYDLLRRAEA